MKYRLTHIHYFAICILGLLINSTSANAGSFRDFILGDELSNAAETSIGIPSDSESARCMQCHNGNSAKAVSLKHADTAMTFTSHGSSNHPVGMSYASYARKDPASYITPARLDSRVKLENGKVTCISCHETKKATSHNTEVVLSESGNTATNTCSSTKALTTGPSQTHLCMTCHAI